MCLIAKGTLFGVFTNWLVSVYCISAEQFQVSLMNPGMKGSCTGPENCQAKVQIDPTENGVQFEATLLNGVEPSQYGVWLAVGISSDTFMGDDVVVECFRSIGSNGETSGQKNSYNTPSKQNFIVSDQGTDGVIHGDTTFENNILVCTWLRQYQSSTTYGYNNAHVDLEKNTYNILLAHGSLTVDGSKNKHKLKAKTVTVQPLLINVTIAKFSSLPFSQETDTTTTKTETTTVSTVPTTTTTMTTPTTTTTTTTTQQQLNSEKSFTNDQANEDDSEDDLNRVSVKRAEEPKGHSSVLIASFILIIIFITTFIGSLAVANIAWRRRRLDSRHAKQQKDKKMKHVKEVERKRSATCKDQPKVQRSKSIILRMYPEVKRRNKDSKLMRTVIGINSETEVDRTVSGHLKPVMSGKSGHFKWMETKSTRRTDSDQSLPGAPADLKVEHVKTDGFTSAGSFPGPILSSRATIWKLNKCKKSAKF